MLSLVYSVISPDLEQSLDSLYLYVVSFNYTTEHVDFLMKRNPCNIGGEAFRPCKWLFSNTCTVAGTMMLIRMLETALITKYQKTYIEKHRFTT